MPFEKVYSVNFSNGNLHPEWNKLNWPDMARSDESSTVSDAEGMNLSVYCGILADEEVHNSVYVQLPQDLPLPLDNRLWMLLEFDMPKAVPEHFPDGVEPVPPEPWAVVLWISPRGVFGENPTVNVTTQFLPAGFLEERPAGIRLNALPKYDPNATPPQPGYLQKDQGDLLEKPLDYAVLQAHAERVPDPHSDYYIDVPPPLFTLEHSFCGWNARTNGHAPGMGVLKILRPWRANPPWPGDAETKDHRVYSNNAATLPGSPEDTIKAVGITLKTGGGVGRMSVRLRRFEVWVATIAKKAV